MLSFCREQGPKSSPRLLMKCCWKTLVPVHCAQRPNYFWNVLWNSGNPDRDQGSSTASAQSVDWFVGDCSPYLEPAEVTWVSLLVFVCWFIRLFIIFCFLWISETAKESSGNAGVSSSRQSNILLVDCPVWGCFADLSQCWNHKERASGTNQPKTAHSFGGRAGLSHAGFHTHLTKIFTGMKGSQCWGGREKTWKGGRRDPFLIRKGYWEGRVRNRDPFSASVIPGTELPKA